MWTDSFSRSKYHVTSYLTVGLSLKVYELLLKITFPVEKLNGVFT